MSTSLFFDLILEILVKSKDLNYFCGVSRRKMAKKKPLKSLKKGDEIKFIPKEELQNMRLNLSIEIPKEDFDELVKAMMGMDENRMNPPTKN